MSKIKKFYKPESLDEILSLLSEEENVILGGGTTLVKTTPNNVSGIISLKNMNYDYIEEKSDRIVIGASTSVQKIYKNELIKSNWGGILTSACKNIGSTLNRNLITIAGNITGVFPWSDIPVVLSVLCGNVIYNDNQKISFNDFFKKNPVLEGFGKNKVITAIEIEKDNENKIFFWESFQKTKVDYAMSTFCGWYELENNKVKELKTSVSALTLLPVRLNNLEEGMKGKELNKDEIAIYLKKDFEEIPIRSDYRVSKAYISEVTQNLIVKNIVK